MSGRRITACPPPVPPPCPSNIDYSMDVGALIRGYASQGAQGPQGSQGAQGSQGSQGAQGAQGSQGVEGVQGPQGSQGSQGAQGAQGTQGVAAGSVFEMRFSTPPLDSTFAFGAGVYYNLGVGTAPVADSQQYGYAVTTPVQVVAIALVADFSQDYQGTAQFEVGIARYVALANTVTRAPQFLNITSNFAASQAVAGFSVPNGNYFDAYVTLQSGAITAGSVHFMVGVAFQR